METPSPNLRKRQKELARKAVLTAAISLFSKNGYEKTTMQAIADQAGVSIATVSRHFGRKIKILAALLQRDLEEIFAVSDDIVESPRGSLEEVMTELLTTNIELLDKPSKKSVSGSLPWLGVKSGIKEIDDITSWADDHVQKQIMRLLLYYQNIGRLRDDIPLDDLAAVVFSVFNNHYLYYSHGSNTEELKGLLTRRVKLLFMS